MGTKMLVANNLVCPECGSCLAMGWKPELGGNFSAVARHGTVERCPNSEKKFKVQMPWVELEEVV